MTLPLTMKSAPIVPLVFGSNLLWTNRRITEVFPTPISPIRMTEKVLLNFAVFLMAVNVVNFKTLIVNYSE